MLPRVFDRIMTDFINADASARHVDPFYTRAVIVFSILTLLAAALPGAYFIGR